jgi:enoyl-CoA hydratase/carnithine racemase
MEERVSISISDGIADVRLVRADKMNALDAAMFEALVAATERLAHEKGLRAVVLSGEGLGVLRRPRYGPVCRHEGAGR